MKRTLLSIATIFAVTFGLNAQVQGYSVGQTVNDFTVTDVHGNTHTLSSWTNAGKWVIIDFFFTTCGPCQQTVPYFSELHEKYGCNTADLACISIDVGDSDTDVLGFESTYSMSGGNEPAPAVSGLDGGGNAVISDFNPAAYPTYCLIDPTMVIRNVDIWPVGSVTDFESAFSAAGFSPTVASCGLSVEEKIGFGEFVVYPNPAADNTTIAVKLDASSDVNVAVYNMVGALVSEESFMGVAGSNSFALNTTDLENGQYLVKVAFGNNAATQTTLNIMK